MSGFHPILAASQLNRTKKSGDLRWFTTETCLTVMNSRIHIGKTGSIFPGTSCNSLASWSTTDKRAWPFTLWHCQCTLGCSTKATAWEGARPAWSDLGPTSYTVQLQWESYFAGKDCLRWGSPPLLWNFHNRLRNSATLQPWIVHHLQSFGLPSSLPSGRLKLQCIQNHTGSYRI